MKAKIRFLCAISVALLMSVIGCHSAFAGDIPIRPVRIVVPSTPGGALDILSRMLAQKLPQRWGQPLVVVN